ncbi:M36 family metallopeptidase [Nevskia sp.]|uniref:M36 family metallopeptidase n=1 Tax=Nevskia sp. TaxID=1929292 RepID=UPI0025F27B5E|nr:M36 family metallopeptidase [Nevskia sp.]
MKPFPRSLLLILLCPVALAGPANYDAAAAASSAAIADQERGQARLPKLDGLPSEFDAALGAATFLWPDAGIGPALLAPLRASLAADHAARHYLRAQAGALRINAASVADARLYELHDTGRGPLIARFRQQHAGLPVIGRELNVMMDRSFKLLATSGNFAAATAAPGARHRLSPEQALARAYADLAGANAAAPVFSAKNQVGDYRHFEVDAVAGVLRIDTPPRSKPVWYALDGRLRPAYYLELSGQRADNGEMLAYASVIGADDGQLLARKNLVEDAEHSYQVFADADGIQQPFDGPLGNGLVPFEGRFPDVEAPRIPAQTQFVTLANGPISTADPWLPVGASETSGNNVDAYLDLVGPDGFTAGSADLRPSVSGSSAFDYPYVVAADPATLTQRQHAGVNLFYVNNWLHDWWYDNGFDEAAGNAQVDNYGRGGIGGDPIRAESQDSSGRNNANMRTPADGMPPRMQMFLWDYNLTLPAPGEFRISAPTTLAGALPFGTSVIGPQTFDLEAEMVAIVDAVAPMTDACQTPFLNAEAVSGRIALLSHPAGACTFAIQLANLKAAGAVAAVYGFGSPNPINLSTSTPGIGIPVLSLTSADADRIRAALASAAVVARLRREPSFDIDSTMDNQIVAHEWFHYASNRLVGDALGLSNQQGRGMGEGWSDFNALLLSVREEDRLVPGNDRHQGAHSVSFYSIRDGYFGIRRAPYSTDFDLFPLTFRHISDGEPLPTDVPLNPRVTVLPNSQVHNTGSIWCNVLWEAYVSLLNDPRHSHLEAQTRMKDYVIAGLKMTPNAPTLLEARNAIIAAARANDSRDGARISNAFAKRGMGVLARGPDRNSMNNIGVRESYLSLSGVLLPGRR